MPNLLDIDDFCKDLKEVTSSKIMNRKRYHSEGLFSEQIFGPVKNYTCQCGIFHGVSKNGSVCSDCGVDIVSATERRKRYAKIVLPFPIINPIFYDILVEFSEKNVADIIRELTKNENSRVYFVNDKDYSGFDIVTSSDALIPDNSKVYEKMEAISQIVKFLADNPGKAKTELWSTISNNLGKLMIRNVIVLPPDLRPAAKGVEKNEQIADKINRYYMQILTKKEKMEESLINIHQDKKLFYEYFRPLQGAMNELYKHILDKLSKKEGLIRGHILGKRIDFSGRAVISPDPTLNLDECSIPYLMFLELFKLPIARKLLESSKFKLLNQSIDYVDECIIRNNLVLLPLAEKIAKKEVCILNRQPSLHRLGMIAFKPRISTDKTIKIHPLACSGYNADFDGDQMAVYVPLSEEAKQECYDKLLMSKNLVNPSNLSLSTVPSQDIVLGIYLLTANKFKKLISKINFKDVEITKSRKIFNICLPKEYPLINDVVDKNKLMFILNDIAENYDSDTAAKTLDKIKNVGFLFSTLYGATMSLHGFVLKDAKKMKDDVLYKETNPQVCLSRVNSNETKEFLKNNFDYSYIVESGARGNFDQVRQIILTRGFVANFNGEILETPIQSSLVDGLNEKEFFNSTYGSRKGLLDVALNTGASGYLSRKLLFSCANVQLDKNLDDCGTRDCLPVFVNNENKAKMLILKWMDVDGNLTLITKENYRDIVGKNILVRSPIFCKNEKLCKKCYGELHKTVGNYVGIVAAQALGECNTQLVLRTFHTSGVAVIKDETEDVEMKQMDIVGDLATAASLLHLSHENNNKNYVQLITELFEVYNTSKKIHHVHFECVVSQMMRHNRKKWRITENRHEITPKYFSILSIPSYEGWLLGMAFSETKKNIIFGLYNDETNEGVYDKILRGQPLE